MTGCAGVTGSTASNERVSWKAVRPRSDHGLTIWAAGSAAKNGPWTTAGKRYCDFRYPWIIIDEVWRSKYNGIDALGGRLCRRKRMVIRRFAIRKKISYGVPGQYQRMKASMIDFGILWNTMEQKGVAEMDLKQYGVTDKQLEALRSNDDRKVSTKLVERICTVLDCSVAEVMEQIH